MHDDTAKRPRLGRTKAKPSDTNTEKAKLTMLEQVHSTLSATSNDCLEVLVSSKHALHLRLRRNIMNMLYAVQEAG